MRITHAPVVPTRARLAHDLRGRVAAAIAILEGAIGLLRSQALTLDGEVTLIGPANMDRRSFDLNDENTILPQDEGATALVRAPQAEDLARARNVTLAEVEAWPLRRQLWNNFAAVLSPIL